MKTLVLLSLIILSSCLTKSSISQIDSRNDCINSRKFGLVDICLPEITGMVEMYSNPIVKEMADFGKYQSNVILGLYLNEKYKSNLDAITFYLDDYFKLYALGTIKGQKISTSFFEEVARNNQAGWDGDMPDIEELEKKLEEKSLSKIDFGKPLIIDFYRPNPKIFTSINLVNIKMNSEEKKVLCLLSYVHMKNTIICYAYYRNYKGPKTLEEFKAKSDLFGLKLMEINS